MKINLVAFGIAREILKVKQLEFEIEGNTLSALRENLLSRHPEFAKLQSLKFAVGENYQEDNFTLSENDEVVIIPPVSGG